MNESRESNPLNRIIREKSKLPPLQDGYTRVVHVTNNQDTDNIAENGLDYSKQGMAMSTARAVGASSFPDDWITDDPRFNFPGAKAVVIDVPNGEWKSHNNISKSTGLIPSNY